MSRKPHPNKSKRKILSLLEVVNKTFAIDPYGDDSTLAYEFLKNAIWEANNGNPICPKCGSINIADAPTSKHQPYRCRDCRGRFGLKTDTLMSRTRMSYQVWVIAIYLLATDVKGTSSLRASQYHFDNGQHALWHLFHRLRKVFEDNETVVFEGPVEVDEVYPDGIVKNYSNKKRTEYHAKTKGKAGGTGEESIVIGMYDRASGKVIAEVMPDGKGETLRDWVLKHTVDNCIVLTDGDPRYKPLARMDRKHYSVNHKRHEYVRYQLVDEDILQITTNRIESFWAHIRRSHKGIFHKWSKKHLQRYLDQLCGVYNIRDLDTIDQMKYIAKRLVGKKLTYKDLVADNGKPSGANDGSGEKRRWARIRAEWEEAQKQPELF